MAEEGGAPTGGEQETASPQIEGEILELLAGGRKETALDFVAYLRANQMTPQQWFGPTYWRVPYEKYYLCSILIDKGRWRVFFFSGDYSGEFTEEFIATVQNSVAPCVSCVDDCPKAKRLTVFGKEFSDTCFQFPIQFVNPDAGTLECIKALVEYWKEAAPRSDSWHAH
jgi:hypothetical protein